jgi:hypothetical protein
MSKLGTVPRISVFQRSTVSLAHSIDDYNNVTYACTYAALTMQSIQVIGAERYQHLPAVFTVREIVFTIVS